MSLTVAPEAPGSTPAPTHSGHRALVVAWQHPDDRSIYPIGMLRRDGTEYSFRYIRAVRAAPGFRPLLGFGYLDRVYTSDRLFLLFAQRAMDSRRPDYVRYVSELGLDPSEASPWEQITRSSGRRQGDTLQLFPVPQVVNGRVWCSFLVHGMRHIPENDLVLRGSAHPVTAEQIERTMDRLTPGSHLDLVPEPTNQRNPEAIVVMAGDTPLGYVPDLLVHDLHRLRAITDVRASVIRTNGPEAPSHLRMLASLAAESVAGFEFFEDERWLPLV